MNVNFSSGVESDDDGLSTKDLESSSTAGESNTDGSRDSSREGIVKEEEKAVRRAKIFVGFAVMTCAVAVFVAVLFLTKRSDTRSFEIEVCLHCDVISVGRSHLHSNQCFSFLSTKVT